MAQAPSQIDLPLLQALPGNMRKGLSIHLRGSIPVDARMLHIDLQEGPGVDPNSDSISLQINFNFIDGAVFRSTFDADLHEWGPGEFSGGMPMNRGYEFDVVVKCQVASFCVTVNEEVFCVFQHRRNPTAISHVLVDGDAVLRVFEIIPPMLLGLPRFCSASGMFAEAYTDDFAAIMRKRIASLVRRIRGSPNSILCSIADRSQGRYQKHWNNMHCLR